MAGETPAVIALDAIEEGLARQWEVLIALEARPIPDLAGLARRLEDVADAVERLQPVPRPRRTRPWWLTPGLVLLAGLVGVLVGWESLRWRVVQGVVFPVQAVQPVAPAKRGK